MDYGTLNQFVAKDLGDDGKQFYISGYYNPQLKSTARSNIKPTQVTMHKNDPDNPHTTGMYYYDKQFKYSVAKNSKGKIMPVSGFVYVFDTLEEAKEWYNSQIQAAHDGLLARANKLMENFIP